MNDKRRRQIQKLKDALREIGIQVEQLRNEEEAAFDALSESLQQAPNGQKSEQAISDLDDAVNSLTEAVDYLDTAAGI